MKKRLQFLFTVLAAVTISSVATAQCPAGQGQLDIEVVTDNWGYEAYFQIVLAGNSCGAGTIFAAGNTNVGCSGGGAQTAAVGDPGAYPDNTTTTENIGCFNLTDCFTLVSVDDWGDGLTTFNILVDGVQLYSFTATGANDSFDFCMQLLNYDLSVQTATIGSPYVIIPNQHATFHTFTFDADVSNSGQMDLTNVTVTAVVNDGSVDVNTSTSTPIANLASLTTNNVTLSPTYTLSQGVKDYTVTFTGSMTETDEDMSNNTLVKTISVTDSTLGRVDSIVNSIGIGGTSTAADDKKLGQIFSSPIDDVVTSITGIFVNPTVGDSTRFSIWDVSGGLPNTMLVSTDAHVFVSGDSILTLSLPAPFNVVAGTDYVVMVHEYNNNVTIGYNPDNYQPNSAFVVSNSIAGGAWNPLDAFGTNFMFNLALYVNFGEVVGVEENTVANASVYPVPSSDVVNFQLSSDVNNMTVKVYGMDGKIVNTRIVSGNNFVLNIQDLPKGIYMVELNDNSSREVYRIVKQ